MAFPASNFPKRVVIYVIIFERNFLKSFAFIWKVKGKMRLFEKYFDGFDFACSGHDIFTCFSWTFSGNELDCLENNKICY